ncbi:MAG: type II secretion system secretin GspD, partial [Gammaproteobacteria bacterium]|nr:type II secretion system secretin GspD [Gammaproteobacteria bacterium]
GSLGDLAPEEIVTRVIPAQNVAAAELVKILRPMIPQYGHLAAVSNPNVVIISDHVDNIQRLMKIIKQIDVADEEQIVVVPMKDAWVGDIVALLEKVAPEQLGRSATGPQRIQVIANERNNTLILRGKTRPMATVLSMVEKLDQPATAAGATRVIFLNHADAVAVAEILNGLMSNRPAASATEGAQLQETTIQADESINAIVVRADPGTMNEIIEIITMLDVRRTMVLIEAAIVEIAIDDSFALGIEAAAVDGSGDAVPFVTTTLNGIVGSLLASIADEDGNIDPVQGISAATSPTVAIAKLNSGGLSFGVIVNALATNTNANLLSTPSILTLDNEEAKILVGQSVPFRTGSFTTTADGASNPFQTIQREDIGVELTVTPHVHEGNLVRLEIVQSVESVIADVPIGASGASDLVTNKRLIETTVLAEDGQTIVLGGLIRDEFTETEKRVPFFGSIPWIGKLFSSTSRKRTKQNLLIFLRPTVIRSVEEMASTTERKYRQGIYEVLIEGISSGTVPTPDDIVEGTTRP